MASVRTEPGTWVSIAVVLLIAFALSRVLPRVVRRVVQRMLDARVRRPLSLFGGQPRELTQSGPVPEVRRAQRAEALGTLAKQLTGAIIWLVAAMVVLHQLQFAFATVVTGAGFLGLAVALGAQDLLRDYIAGFFMLVDDRFGVGDRVDVGGRVGDIQQMTLRWTRLRDLHGTEWYVANRRLEDVGNLSHHRGVAIVDIDLPSSVHLADALDRISKALQTWARILRSGASSSTIRGCSVSSP